MTSSKSSGSLEIVGTLEEADGWMFTVWRMDDLFYSLMYNKKDDDYSTWLDTVQAQSTYPSGNTAMGGTDKVIRKSNHVNKCDEVYFKIINVLEIQTDNPQFVIDNILSYIIRAALQ